MDAASCEPEDADSAGRDLLDPRSVSVEVSGDLGLAAVVIWTGIYRFVAESRE